MPFIELPTIDSTNNYARNLIREGKGQHGMAIFTYDQTAGKGQRGKSWETEKGMNLAVSLIVKPDFLTISQQFQLSAATALACHDFFSHYAGDATKIKWPNDLYWQDRKAGGILIESIVSETGKWEWAIIGIGINLNQVVFSENLPNPVSLRQITGKSFDGKNCAQELIGKLSNRYYELKENGFNNLHSSYLEHLYKKGDAVRLKKNAAAFIATIDTVTAQGELIITHGITESIQFGEIEWLK
jgi:BirA family biotin operon repressor/biotin-[acetyl-CoA-carboxylase] ligase